MPSGVYTRIKPYNPKCGFQKGHRDFSTIESRERQSIKISGKNNVLWRGEKAKYSTKHNWIRRHFGQPTICEECGKGNLRGKKIHWANKSGMYKRNINDWIRLCVSCHFKLDQVDRKRDWHGKLL